MTNREYAKKERSFIKACELAEIPATGRQASKYRRERGKAYEFIKEALVEVVKEEKDAD